MQRHSIVLLVALIAAVPAASATWFAYGTYEPDTAQDAAGGYMRTDADQEVGGTGQKLYFNAYQTEFGAGTSINVAAVGSRYQMAGAQNWEAILGPWRDCNGDDYVGLAETAMTVYPSALLLDDSICPASAGSIHNDGQWVYEYVPVGHQHGETPQDPQLNVIDDLDALVWADIGLPGAQAAGTCPISPFPHGTTSGTGWLIRYADCFASRRIENTINDVDSDGSLGIRFDDTTNPQQTDSLLNQHFPESLFGNPTTGETGTLQLDSNEDGGQREYAFTTWDCNGRALEVKDPTGAAPRSIAVPDANQPGSLDGNEDLTDSDGNYAWVASPSPTAPTADSARQSWADGLNQTFMGIHAGSGDADNDASFTGGDCNYESQNDNGDNTYSSLHQTLFFRADSPFEPPADAKKETDDYFIFFNGARNPPEVEDALGERTTPAIVSTPTTAFLQGDAIWQSNTIWVTTPQAVNRATLQPSQATYWSFYAKVGATTLAAGYSTTGNSKAYGAEACGGFTDGVHNGWDCNADHWYTDSNFQPIVDGNEVWQARAGMVYQFRDIDCVDGTVARGGGVQASLLALGPTFNPDADWSPCADAPL